VRTYGAEPRIEHALAEYPTHLELALTREVYAI
jgi:hypothetical protein